MLLKFSCCLAYAFLLKVKRKIFVVLFKIFSFYNYHTGLRYFYSGSAHEELVGGKEYPIYLPNIWITHFDCLVEPVVKNGQEEEGQESHAQEVGSQDVVPAKHVEQVNYLFWTTHQKANQAIK